MTLSIEQDIKDVLNKIDQRFDKIETKIDNLSKDVSDVKISISQLIEKGKSTDKEIQSIKEDVKELKSTQKAQIWSLIIAVFTAILGLSTLLVRFSFNAA